MVLQQASLFPVRLDPRPPPKWFNSPVTFHTGTLSDIGKHIPTFERRPFTLNLPSAESIGVNSQLDTIVRQPFGEDKSFMPVGIVSKEYAFLQHTAVLDVAVKALATAKIDPGAVKVDLKITAYGERMAISLYLPDKYSFDPGDGNPMAMRLECLNSVDGSTRFRALMGWFRFVCSNGLVIGVTRSDVRRRHVGGLQINDVGKVLAAGIAASATEKRNLVAWRKRPIPAHRIVPWIKKDLRRTWGFKAATRAFHIAATGHDVEITGQFKQNDPTTIQVQSGERVKGTPEHSENLFDLSQILAWLAKDRRDLQEQVEWREQIPQLLAPLSK
ncbi:MAG: DUF932 domain-containing protein [Kiritimatiellia bacterium]